MRRAAAYIRVSRAREDGVSPENQLEKARQWCSLHGAQLLYVEEDIDASGRTDRRPGFQRLMEHVRSGEIDLVIIYKIDRFGRNVKDFHQHVATLEAHGVDLVSVSQNFDTSTPIGRLIRNILADFAQFESEMIGERVADTKREHAARGGWAGGRVPYGYRWDPGTKRLVIDERRAQWVRQIYKWYLDGQGSTSMVADLDGVAPSPGGRGWNDQTIRWILRNPIYIGKMPYEGKVYDAEHDPIVDEETFELVQHRLGNSPHARSGSGKQHLLSALVRCGLCGSVAHVTYTGPESYRRYICSKRNREGKAACPSPLLDADSLEAAVVAHLLALGREQDIDQWLKAQAETRSPETDGPEVAEVNRLRNELARIERTMHDLFADYYDAKIITREQFMAKNQEYLAESERLKATIEGLEAEIEADHMSAANAQAWKNQAILLSEVWEEATMPERQMALGAIVRGLAYGDTHATVDVFVSEVQLPARRRRGTLYFGTKP